MGWNVSNRNLYEIFHFIDNMRTETEEEKRNKKILEYAFIDNMSALKISKLNDDDLICLSNKAKGERLTSNSISRIIKSYGLIKEKKTKQPVNYDKRKELAKKLNNGEIKKKEQCELCKSKNNLVLHHKKALSLGGTNEKANLITVCENCHKKIHYGNERAVV